mmetsp:Transcript_2688/g.3848  ORF Transcript_2688/g.3848 Transcript_2688/m.3848 type:complete len:512 (+) Transcript_2688:367-1902(+)
MTGTSVCSQRSDGGDDDQDLLRVPGASFRSESTELGHSAHRDVGTSSVAKVTFNFVNAVVGSGILAMPYAIQQAGLVTGLGMAALICLLTAYTVRLLVETGLHEGVRNYEELMDKLFGFWGYACILLLLFLYDFGAMVSYLIILGDVCSSVFYEIATDFFGMSEHAHCLNDHWCLRRFCIIIPSVFLVLPLCLLRDISRLEKASTFAVVTIIGVIIVVVISAAIGDNCPNRDIDPSSCPDTSASWLTVVGDNPSAAFGILAFGFVCHDTAFMFFNSLRNPTGVRWRRVTNLSLTFSVGLGLLLAVPGYLSFRGNIKQNILENFAPDDYKILIVRTFFMLTMACTYPMCFFICRHIINEFIYRWQRRHRARTPGTPAGLSIAEVSRARHLILTLSIFTINVIIVCFVDQLGLVMSLTGNVSAVSIAFILPPLCSMKSRWNRKQVCDHARVASGSDTGLGLSETLLHGATEGVACNACNEARKEPSSWPDICLLAFGIFTMGFCTAQTLLDKK